MPKTKPPTPVLGLIGGSGLGKALASETDGSAKTHSPHTPFGQPSSPITELTWSGRRLFVLQRHGSGHTLNPSK